MGLGFLFFLIIILSLYILKILIFTIKWGGEGIIFTSTFSSNFFIDFFNCYCDFSCRLISD